MPRVRILAALFIALSSLGLSAQAPLDTTGNSVTVQEQLRRVAPPPEDLTAAQLEARADELRAEKAYLDALDYYHAAIRKQPSAVLYNKAGIAQLSLMRYREARKDFQRSIKVDKTYAEAYNNLGVIHYIERSLRRATKNYEKAIKYKPISASFHSNLGTAYFARRQYEKATLYYQRALEIDPDIFERRSHAGISAHMSSPEDRARYHYVIAKMYATRGDQDRCLLYLRKAVEDGYPPKFSAILQEPAFAQLRTDPRFVALQERRPAVIPQ